MYDNEYIIDVNHRDYGKLNWVGVPTRFSGTPNKHKPSNEHESWHAPWIGEHSLTALVNILGYTKEEANTLMKSQVVPDPTGPRAIQTSRNARDKYAAKMKKRKEKFENKRSKL